jgi:hypothetical protein
MRFLQFIQVLKTDWLFAFLAPAQWLFAAKVQKWKRLAEAVGRLHQLLFILLQVTSGAFLTAFVKLIHHACVMEWSHSFMDKLKWIGSSTVGIFLLLDEIKRC